MLLYMQLSVQVLNVHVVNAKIVSRSYGVDAVEDAFRPSRSRKRTNRDVGIRKNAVDGVRYRRSHALGVLQRCIAIERHLHFSEVSIARATHAHAINIEHAVNVGHSSYDLAANAGGSRVEQRVDRLPRQPGAHINNDTCDSQSSQRISHSQPGNAHAMADPHQGESDYDDTARPNICGEVQGVG